MSEKVTGIVNSSLDRSFRPKSVAIVGASPKIGTARNMLVRGLLKHGYDGRVYPVTPSNEQVEGHKAYKTLADIPEIPDVALIITPAQTVPGIINECGQKGIRNAIVYSAGFEEVEGGAENARQLRQAAENQGVSVIGPNGSGLWSIRSKAILTSGGGAYSLENLIHAPIAIISQSGALSGAIGASLQRNGIGCSYIVSVGNETCLDALDILAWVIEQEDVRVVGLYLEGMRDAWRFLPLAARARTLGIQITVLKAGRSSFGQEATASHTGKIASPHSIYCDVLEQAGVVVVESIAELMAAVEVFSLLPAPRHSEEPNSGTSILSSSGGAGALLADHGDQYCVPLSEFGEATIANLTRILPQFARKANPVDLTGQIRAIPNLFRDALNTIGEDRRTEAVIVQMASGGMRDIRDNAEAFKSAAQKGRYPLIISFAGDTIPSALKSEFREAGILLSDDPAHTMRALGWLYQRQGFAVITTAERLPKPIHAAPRSWQETVAFLDSSGIPAPPWRILKVGDRAVDLLSGMDWPVVVKVQPSDVAHKTELGLVKLRVQTPAEVDDYAAEFRRILGAPELSILVQEMITDGIEVVLSVLRDTDFGPVISIGSGGVSVELYKDITFLALPVTHNQVYAALKKLKVWTLLQGFRGAPKADIEALVAATVRFGNMVLASPELAEAEINPILVRPAGKGLAAVDFLGAIRPKAS